MVFTRFSRVYIWCSQVLLDFLRCSKGFQHYEAFLALLVESFRWFYLKYLGRQTKATPTPSLGFEETQDDLMVFPTALCG